MKLFNVQIMNMTSNDRVFHQYLKETIQELYDETLKLIKENGGIIENQ